MTDIDPIELPQSDLERLKTHLATLGYRFETDRNGVQRMYRPDGTLAVTARCDHKFIDSRTCLKCGWLPDGT